MRSIPPAHSKRITVTENCRGIARRYARRLSRVGAQLLTAGSFLGKQTWVIPREALQLPRDHRSIGLRASMRPARCSGTRVSPGSAKTVRLVSREGRRDLEEYGRQLPSRSQT